MIRTIEAVIDEEGTVHLLEEIRLTSVHRALVTILEEEPQPVNDEVTVLSETALAEDWNRPEEEVAWSHLQPVQ